MHQIADTANVILKNIHRKQSLGSLHQSCQIQCDASPEVVPIAHQLLKSLKTNYSEYFKNARPQSSGNHVIKERAISGSDLINWFCKMTNTTNRDTAIGAWQYLIQEGVLFCCNQAISEMRDSNQEFYHFHEDVCTDKNCGFKWNISSADINGSDTNSLKDCLSIISEHSSDALIRLVLQKPRMQRSSREIDLIFPELLHLKALSKLSPMLLRQLTQVLIFETHVRKGEALFRQGDVGKSWYIILRGSVDISIQGKGVVCTLQEGDDFGELALINNSPRAATAILAEENCQLLRVDKQDFYIIKKEVEDNTSSLQEHGQVVLVLGKSGKSSSAKEGSPSIKTTYSIISGTPEKMLEYIMESCIDTPVDYNQSSNNDENMLHDFLLTQPVFLPGGSLCNILKSMFSIDITNSCNASIRASVDRTKNEVNAINQKRRIIYLILSWSTLLGESFFHLKGTRDLTEYILDSLIKSARSYPIFETDISIMKGLAKNFIDQEERQTPQNKRMAQRSKLSKTQTTTRTCASSQCDRGSRGSHDILTLYLKDHSKCLIKSGPNATVDEILQMIPCSEELPPSDRMVLIEMKSSGEKVVLDKPAVGIVSTIGVNSRLFLVDSDDLSEVVPLPEQIPSCEPICDAFVHLGVDELAHHISQYDWELLERIRIYEFIYCTLGRQKFNEATPNLDIFVNQFSRLQYWVETQICITSQLNKRVNLVKKFIKVANRLLEINNFSSFFAIMMGLNNSSVSRLRQTWDKVNPKYSKLFSDLNRLLDPSRNHRVLRQRTEKVDPPVLPFLAIILKDITFIHEGNKTYAEDGLVNFEKMQLIAKSLKMLLNCRSKKLQITFSRDLRTSSPSPSLTIPGSGGSNSINMDLKSYVRALQCIDNQKQLTTLSQKLEPPQSK